MLRTRLLTATAAVALFAAGSAFAQTAPTAGAQPPAPGQTVTTPPAAPDPAPPVVAQPVTPASIPTAPAAAAAGAQTQTPAAQNTVVDVLRARGQFTTLLSALDAAQLTETLSTQPAVSIFAPTDAAFAALPEAERTRLLDPANVNDLRQLLLYHVIVADVNSAQIDGARGGVETAAGVEVQLDGAGDAIKVDNATVTTADIDASNGSVFIIDRVLNPAESQVATGDAEEATAPADEAAPVAPPPAETDEVVPPPVDDSVEGPPEPNAPVTDEDAPDDMDAVPDAGATPPAAPTPTIPPTASTTTTPAPAGVNAPNGQPASSVTTVASPPVPNPTDGQVDGQNAGDTNDADTTAPEPQS
jgi:uncharacterized surface protein with fasciclin (FAS1) repeats